MGGEGGASALRYYGALTPIVATAIGEMAVYLVVERVAGPSLPRASAWFRAWCAHTCRRLDISVRAAGAPQPAPCIYVANHRSYLDILVLGGVIDASFLSRADVATWPLIGSAARRLGTVFLERDDPRSGARAARALARRVRTRSAIIFPEGTTGGAPLPQPFVDGAFRLLERLDVPIVPVTLRYNDRRAYWIDELGMGEHLRRRVLAGAPLVAALHIGAPIHASEHPSADALAAAVYDAVCAPIECFGETVES